MIQYLEWTFVGRGGGQGNVGLGRWDKADWVGSGLGGLRFCEGDAGQGGFWWSRTGLSGVERALMDVGFGDLDRVGRCGVAWVGMMAWGGAGQGRIQWDGLGVSGV